MSNFFYNLGKMVGQTGRKANWFVQTLSGTDADALNAEHAVGRDLAQAYVQENPVDPDADVKKFLDSIAARLCECVTDPNRKFTFQAVQKDEFNAFALPGGFIFITRPLLEMCDWNVDEIAFVLGHEMGHVLARHTVNRMLASSMIRTGLMRFPVGGLLGMGILEVVTGLLDQGYSREQELEADNMGVKLAHFAGFDGDAAKRVLIRLGGVPNEGWLGSKYFSSHPPASARIEHIDQFLREQRG